MPTKSSQKISDQIKFMQEACWMCDKSVCKTHSGAVAVKDGKIVSSGYNELLSTFDEVPVEIERDNVIHAEASLVAKAALKGLSLEGATLYTTRFPCVNCTRLIYKSGIKKIYYMSNLFTAGNDAKSLLDKLNVKVEQLKEEVVWKA